MSKPIVWSFSALKLFEQCPRKYYHLKILRDVKEEETEAIRYGNEFHEAAEHYVDGTAELPARFGYARAALDKLKNMAGEKLCEYRMGLTEDLEPCTTDDPKVWWRGIADLTIVNGKTAKVIDHKTGLSAKYADTDQLELMALAVFKHFPEIEHIKAGLLFVRVPAFITAEYRRGDAPKLWVRWLQRYNRLIQARDAGVWNPKTSGLCKRHCIVLTCPHNGMNM